VPATRKRWKTKRCSADDRNLLSNRRNVGISELPGLLENLFFSAVIICAAWIRHQGSNTIVFRSICQVRVLLCPGRYEFLVLSRPKVSLFYDEYGLVCTYEGIFAGAAAVKQLRRYTGIPHCINRTKYIAI